MLPLDQYLAWRWPLVDDRGLFLLDHRGPSSCLIIRVLSKGHLLRERPLLSELLVELAVTFDSDEPLVEVSGHRRHFIETGRLPMLLRSAVMALGTASPMSGHKLKEE